MSRKRILFLLLASAFLVFGPGCGNNIQKVQNSSWGSSAIPYRDTLGSAFENGQWSEVKDESGEKVVQFTGKISPAIHDYTIEKLKTSDPKIIFQSACNYLAALNRDGRITQEKAITFDITKLPMKGGIVVYERIGPFISSPENKEIVTTLNNFYLNRYWEAGSDVLIQWGVYSKAIKIKKMTNIHWNDDPLYSGKPDSVLRVVYDYYRK
jgi:hypothetical protein